MPQTASVGKSPWQEVGSLWFLRLFQNGWSRSV